MKKILSVSFALLILNNLNAMVNAQEDDNLEIGDIICSEPVSAYECARFSNTPPPFYNGKKLAYYIIVGKKYIAYYK